MLKKLFTLYLLIDIGFLSIKWLFGITFFEGEEKQEKDDPMREVGKIRRAGKRNRRMRRR